MQKYGKTKRGSNKVHSHDKCSVCSEQDLSKSAKHRARQKAKKDINASVVE